MQRHCDEVLTDARATQAQASRSFEFRAVPGADDALAIGAQVLVPAPRERRSLMRTFVAVGEDVSAAPDEKNVAHPDSKGWKAACCAIGYVVEMA